MTVLTANSKNKYEIRYAMDKTGRAPDGSCYNPGQGMPYLLFGDFNCKYEICYAMDETGYAPNRPCQYLR